ncbi:MAG: MFS transporter [Candidatus Altiarchaeota archaeon]|nr:MFS transporter [Candidatus Altiarchaeota archaeon]
MLRFRRFKRYKPLYGVVAAMFAWTVGSGVMWYLLPQIVESFFSDVWMVGVVIALPNLLSMIVDLPAGEMVDKLGRRRVLLFAFLMLALLGVGLFHVKSSLQLLLFLVGLGLTYQTVYISTLAYVMDVSPKGEKSKFLGAEMSFIHLGFGIGPILAGFLVSYAGWSMISAASVMYALSCVVAFAVTLLYLRMDRNTTPFIECVRKIVIEDKLFVKELLDYRKLKSTGIVVLYFTFLLTFFDGVVWLIQPLYAEKFGPNPLYAGMIMAAFVLPLVFFEIPGGALADRIGKKKVLFAGFFSAGVFSLLFSQAGSFLALLLTAFMATTGLALTWPSAEGILSDKAPKNERGEVIGVWSLAYDSGYVVGPLAGGLLAYYAGETGVFAFLGVVMILSSALVLLVKE